MGTLFMLNAPLNKHLDLIGSKITCISQNRRHLSKRLDTGEFGLYRCSDYLGHSYFHTLPSRHKVSSESQYRNVEIWSVLTICPHPAATNGKTFADSAGA